MKQHLSEYLDRAERGELVRVTERGRPKALLGPLPGRARIDAGIAEGWITPGSGASAGGAAASLGPTRRWKARRRVLDMLGEDRGD